MTDVTYGTLNKVLPSLGFTCRVLRQKPAARWYEHAETGAIISLPLLPEDHQAYAHHVAAVQGTLDVYGIARSSGLHCGVAEGEPRLVVAD